MVNNKKIPENRNYVALSMLDKKGTADDILIVFLISIVGET